jgi:dimethylargininase
MPAIAITRGISASFARAIVQHVPPAPLEVDAARREHAAYLEALGALGFALVALPPDDRFPDGCFVEDAAVVHEGRALLTRPGAPSRRGEGEALREVLEGLAGIERIETMDAPATLEGGDCLRIGRRLYVGLGARTNPEGLARARAVFGPLGLEVIGVPIGDVLHLKCLCSSPGPGHVLVAEGALPPGTFADVETLVVPRDEAHAANCVAASGAVVIPGGCPATSAALQAAGYRVSTVDNEHIRRADGALTCMSIRIETY